MGWQRHLASHVPDSRLTMKFLRDVCRFPHAVSLSFGGNRNAWLWSSSPEPIFRARCRPAVVACHTEDDRVASGHPYLVLNYDYWKTRFAADPEILGKELTSTITRLTVVGVAQQGFDGVELGHSQKSSFQS